MRGRQELRSDGPSTHGSLLRRSRGATLRDAANAGRWGRRAVVTGFATVLTVGAIAGLVGIAPEVYSPSIAAASNVYTHTVSGATGACSGSWFNNTNLVVPAGIISTQVTLIGGGGGGSTASGTNTTGGVGGGGSQVEATIPASGLPAGSVLYSHLGCGGGAGSGTPTGGAGGTGESDSGTGSPTATGSGAAGGTAQGDNAGGGGGGGSALCVVATAASNCSAGTIIGVAGGGGGAAGAVSRGVIPAPPDVTGAAGGEGAAAGTSNGGAGSATGCTGSGGSGTCTGGGAGTSAAGAAGTGAVSGARAPAEPGGRLRRQALARAAHGTPPAGAEAGVSSAGVEERPAKPPQREVTRHPAAAEAPHLPSGTPPSAEGRSPTLAPQRTTAGRGPRSAPRAPQRMALGEQQVTPVPPDRWSSHTPLARSPPTRPSRRHPARRPPRVPHSPLSPW